MPGFDGTGPRGLGPMTGRCRGFCVVPLPPTSPTLVGRGGYHAQGLPWDMPYYVSRSTTSGVDSSSRQMTREQEFHSLKDRAQAMKGQLQQIEVRIQQLQNKP